jgi:hypothetical protein
VGNINLPNIGLMSLEIVDKRTTTHLQSGKMVESEAISARDATFHVASNLIYGGDVSADRGIHISRVLD